MKLLQTLLTIAMTSSLLQSSLASNDSSIDVSKDKIIAISHPSKNITLTEFKMTWYGQTNWIAVENLSLRSHFYKEILNSNADEINRKLNRMIFSGRVLPPVVLETDAQVLERVANDPQSIGYINKSNLTPQVKPIN